MISPYKTQTVDFLDGSRIIISEGCIETDRICSPALYYVTEPFRIFFDFNLAKAYCQFNGIKLTKKNLSTLQQWFFNETAKEGHSYNEIKSITNWKRVTFNGKGILNIEEFPKTFSLPLKKNFEVLKEWAQKYYKLVHKLIDEKMFIPTLTGGVDTRVMTAFWKDRIDDLNSFYLKLSKKDNESFIKTGNKEVSIAKQVLKILGKDLTLKSIQDDLITCSGLFAGTDELKKGKLNPTDLLKEFPPYKRRREEGIADLFRNLLPFTDNLYVSLDPHRDHFMHVLLPMIFCSDLLDIDFISYSDQPSYNFYSLYPELISEAKNYIKYWGENNVKHIFD